LESLVVECLSAAAGLLHLVRKGVPAMLHQISIVLDLCRINPWHKPADWSCRLAQYLTATALFWACNCSLQFVGLTVLPCWFRAALQDVPQVGNTPTP